MSATPTGQMILRDSMETADARKREAAHTTRIYAISSIECAADLRFKDVRMSMNDNSKGCVRLEKMYKVVVLLLKLSLANVPKLSHKLVVFRSNHRSTCSRYFIMTTPCCKAFITLFCDFYHLGYSKQNTNTPLTILSMITTNFVSFIIRNFCTNFFQNA